MFIKKLACLASLSILSTSVFAQSQTSPYHITLINHYDKPLNVIVGINPDILPDYHSPFHLGVGEQATSQILDLNKEAYLRAEDDQMNNGFFGVEIQNDATLIHGYMSKGVAYSWQGEQLTFCTPDEYKKKQSC